METYADLLRRMAKLLDEDFSKNIGIVIYELTSALHHMVATYIKNKAGD